MNPETADDIICGVIVIIFIVGLVTTVNFIAGLAGVDLLTGPDVDASDFEDGTLEYEITEVEYPDKGIVVEPLERKDRVSDEPDEILIHHIDSDTYESSEIEIQNGFLPEYETESFSLGCGDYKIIENGTDDINGVDIPHQIVVEEVNVPCEDSQQAGDSNE